ncbi:hypothetical protein [Paraburkholderia humisilvae]
MLAVGSPRTAAQMEIKDIFNEVVNNLEASATRRRLITDIDNGEPS